MRGNRKGKYTTISIWLTAVSVAVLLLSGCNSGTIKPLTNSGRMGVVLMHGKGASPQSVASLKRALESVGILVVTPVMPWASGRQYDATFEQSMMEIDTAIRQLKEKGAEILFVGGHSMGANAALGYGARRDDIRGLILLAPGHAPGVPGFAREVESSVREARSLIKSGQGDEKSSFRDTNQNQISWVLTTPNIFLSWFDPNGSAVMSSNAGSLGDEVAVFCADGSGERFPKCTSIENQLPSRVTREIVNVNGDHAGVISASRQQVIEWIRGFD